MVGIDINTQPLLVAVREPIAVNPVHVDPIGVSSIGQVGPVILNPATFHISIDHLPDPLPKITIGVDPLELRLTQLPSIRAHLPADFSVGLSILGVELLCVKLCGEAQVVTEPYRPNPCEHCGAEFVRAPDQ